MKDECPFHDLQNGLRFSKDSTSHGFAATGDLILKVYAAVLDSTAKAGLKPTTITVARHRIGQLSIITDRLITCWDQAGLFRDDSVEEDSDYKPPSVACSEDDSASEKSDEGLDGEEIAVGLEGERKVAPKRKNGDIRASRSGTKAKKAKVRSTLI